MTLKPGDIGALRALAKDLPEPGESIRTYVWCDNPHTPSCECRTDWQEDLPEAVDKVLASLPALLDAAQAHQSQQYAADMVARAALETARAPMQIALELYEVVHKHVSVNVLPSDWSRLREEVDRFRELLAKHERTSP